jgi:hypothetical protein
LATTTGNSPLEFSKLLSTKILAGEKKKRNHAKIAQRGSGEENIKV